jgi:D-sedoheptulose 7-phosphate isomerase
VTDADLARAVCREAATLHQRVADERAEDIARAAAAVSDALQAGRKVLVFGNGGSAADAQHFAAELVGQFSRRIARRALPVMALTTDLAIMSAVANDFGFAAVFARQIDAHGQAGDVAVAISTSGSSANVNEGLRWARDRSMTTIAISGRDGGESGRLADIHVNVPDQNPQRVQEVQQTILHIICELVERRIESLPAQQV